MGYVYIAVNTVNNRQYIGMTTRKPKKAWSMRCRQAITGHDASVLGRVIRLHGREVFNLSVVEECPDEILEQRKDYWVRYWGSDRDGYNRREMHEDELRDEMGIVT